MTVKSGLKNVNVKKCVKFVYWHKIIVNTIVQQYVVLLCNEIVVPKNWELLLLIRASLLWSVISSPIPPVDIYFD